MVPIVRTILIFRVSSHCFCYENCANAFAHFWVDVYVYISFLVYCFLLLQLQYIEVSCCCCWHLVLNSQMISGPPETNLPVALPFNPSTGIYCSHPYVYNYKVWMNEWIHLSFSLSLSQNYNDIKWSSRVSLEVGSLQLHDLSSRVLRNQCILLC